MNSSPLHLKPVAFRDIDTQIAGGMGLHASRAVQLYASIRRSSQRLSLQGLEFSTWFSGFAHILRIDCPMSYACLKESDVSKGMQPGFLTL